MTRAFAAVLLALNGCDGCGARLIVSDAGDAADAKDEGLDANSCVGVLADGGTFYCPSDGKTLCCRVNNNECTLCGCVDGKWACPKSTMCYCPSCEKTGGICTR